MWETRLTRPFEHAERHPHITQMLVPSTAWNHHRGPLVHHLWTHHVGMSRARAIRARPRASAHSVAHCWDRSHAASEWDQLSGSNARAAPHTLPCSNELPGHPVQLERGRDHNQASSGKAATQVHTSPLPCSRPGAKAGTATAARHRAVTQQRGCTSHRYHVTGSRPRQAPGYPRHYEAHAAAHQVTM